MKKQVFSADVLEMIGTRLRMMREHKGCTQREMADMVGISAGHWSRLENGVGGLSEPLLYAITEKLKVTRAYLLGESNDANAPAAGSSTRRQVDEQAVRQAVRETCKIWKDEQARMALSAYAETFGLDEDRAMENAVVERVLG